MREGTLVQTRQQARAIVIMTVPLAGTFTLVGALGATEHQTHHSVVDRIVGVAFCVLVVLGLAAVGYRGARAGVVVYADRIVVRNFWRSREIAWDDIDRFAVGGLGLGTGGYVCLRDGTSFLMWGIEGPNRFLFRNSGSSSVPVARLNEQLALRRPASTQGHERRTGESR